MNLTQLLFDQVERRPEATAIHHAGKRMRFAELGTRVNQAAGALIEAGVTTGEVVAIELDDPLNHWIATLSLAHIGATVISMPAWMPTRQRERLIQACQCRRVIAEGDTSPLGETFSWGTIRWSWIEDYCTIDHISPAEVNADHPWIFVSGSGSTGRAKIMPVTHPTQYIRATLGREWLPYAEDDTLLSLVSIQFYASKQRYLEALAIGAAIYIDTPGKIAHRREVGAGDVTSIYATVFHIEQLLSRLPEGNGLYYDKLNALMLGGSVVSERLRQRIRDRLTPSLYVMWGANESHTSTITSLGDVYKRPAGVGRPLPGARVEIVDENAVPVPVGVVGDIRVASAALISGYLGDTEATEKGFRGEWFYPGDIGYFKTDGTLVHRGRSDDMMIISGVNVYPVEVEDCLRRLPWVKDAIVVPMSHPSLQDLPVGLVVADEAGRPEVEDVLKYVWNQIGRHTLHHLIYVDTIPRNQQGKAQREAILTIIRARWNADRQAKEEGSSKRQWPSQPAEVEVTLTFRPPAEGHFEPLNAWLKVLDEQLLTLNPAENELRSCSQAEMWLRQVLLFGVGLLQVLRYPVFECIEISQCDPPDSDVSGWRAVFQPPVGRLVPADTFDVVLKVSFMLAKWCLTADSDSPSDRGTFFGMIQDKVLNALSSSRPKVQSTYEVLRVAHSMGIPCLRLPSGIFQLGWGCHARYIDRSTTDNDSAMGMRLTENKSLTAQLLQQAGLPSPIHALVDSLQKARQAAGQLGYPVVVKPVDLERGEGVSVDVTEEHLEAAFTLAQKLSPGKRVLIEQQVDGVCHRLFVASGKLLYAVRRRPIGVYADGHSMIHELVSAECSRQQMLPPWKRSRIQPLDDLALQNLERQGWSPESIPSAGQFIALRRIESTAWGGVDEDVTDSVHPDNITAAIAATQLFGLEVAGVDIISTDINKPWHANGAIINEVNYAPLLGGGDISRKSIPEYLMRMIKGLGRIPIHVHAGGETAWEQAMQHWRSLREQGISAYLTKDEMSLDPSGNACILTSKLLADRVPALLMRRDCQALIIMTEFPEREKISINHFQRAESLMAYLWQPSSIPHSEG